MTESSKYVWYASYGSNLLYERFMCYIKGGKPTGSHRLYKGCRNKNLPIFDEALSINRQLYFAKSSSTWDDGGVCFLNTKTDIKEETLARMYLVTEEQFCDIVQQENSQEEILSIDFEQTRKHGELIINEAAWYGNIIHLGDKNGHPIFTFNHVSNMMDEFNPPSDAYLLTIIRGLKETYDIDSTKVFDYLKDKIGLSENIERLNRLCSAES